MTPEELANEIERLSYGWTIHYGWPENIKLEIIRKLREAEHAARLAGARAGVSEIVVHDPFERNLVSNNDMDKLAADIVERMEKGDK